MHKPGWRGPRRAGTDHFYAGHDERRYLYVPYLGLRQQIGPVPARNSQPVLVGVCAGDSKASITVVGRVIRDLCVSTKLGCGLRA